LPLAIPRDRAGTFEPRLIGKHERRFTGFDDKVIALYARGLTVREIQAFLGEMYGTDVSPDLISTVTDAVVAEVTAWQARPLEPMYPVVFFDALCVKIGDEAVVRSKAVYLALAVLPDGTRDVLGIRIEQTEGAKFWMKVFTDLKTRGCQDILIAVTDGLKGMSEALAAVYPATTLQTCIVHLLRNSLDFANWKERKPLAAALRPIYTAASADAALTALDACEQGLWGVRFPTVVAAWRRVWTHVIPFFAFPPRSAASSTRPTRLRACTRVCARSSKRVATFRTTRLRRSSSGWRCANITATWVRGAPTWKTAMNQFAILYGDRFTAPSA
jgi:transposase-like protein